MKRATFRFERFSARQLKVLSWWCAGSPVREHDGIIADGAIRSGKTLSMSLSFAIWAMSSFNGQNFGMCGKTIGSFRRNVLVSLKRMLSARGFRVEDRRGDNLMIVRRGDVENYFYIFGGKDERSQDLIQGVTLAGVFFDEVALMPESFVNQATGRCSVDGSKFWFNCNPEGPEHWFRTHWILKCKEKRLLYLHFTMEDNPSLTERVKERYRAMYSGVFYDRFIRGLWVIAEGLIYDFREINIVDDVPKGGEYYISCDYGTLNPFSAGLWCWDGKTATRIREYYYSGRDEHHNKTDEEYHAELVTLAGDLPVRSVIVDPSAASFIEVIKRHKQFNVRKAVNDVIPGIATTARYLRDGTIKVHRSCKDCIREFGLYRWDEKSTEDRPIKENDHALDDTRYFAMTVLRNKVGKAKYESILT